MAIYFVFEEFENTLLISNSPNLFTDLQNFDGKVLQFFSAEKILCLPTCKYYKRRFS